MKIGFLSAKTILRDERFGKHRSLKPPVSYDLCGKVSQFYVYFDIVKLCYGSFTILVYGQMANGKWQIRMVVTELPIPVTPMCRSMEAVQRRRAWRGWGPSPAPASAATSPASPRARGRGRGRGRVRPATSSRAGASTAPASSPRTRASR